jgi:hydroxypyruvate reductase
MTLEDIFAAAVRACDPAAATRAALGRAEVRAALGKRSVHLAAAGKAARAMASGAGAALGARIVERVVIGPEDAAHPVPDERSERAGRAMLRLAGRVPPDAALLALISGGASSLIAVPAPGLTLAEKVAQTSALAATGAPIAELNRLRSSLSAIKGGRLAAACRAPVITVAVSDVVGDDLAVIGSGPTVPCTVAVLAAGLASFAVAAARASGGTVIDAGVTGDVAAVAAQVVAEVRDGLPGTRIWAGEPTVRLPARPGRGGRARQLALLVARDLAGVPRWSLLAAGSDGVDGTDDAAGAIVDGETWARIRAAGVDPDAALAACDAGTALAAAGAALVTGPTGVNHADLLVARVL